MEELIHTEEKIFVFIINTISFLKTLKKRGLTNERTEQLASLIAVLNDLYGKSADIKYIEQRIELWRIGLEAFKKIHLLLMNLHYSDYDLVNEKADLQIEASQLKDKLSKIIQNTDKH